MINRFKHQQAEWDRHRYDVARAYLWQMRTGKTRAAVESACALHEAMEIGGVLVVAPNGVHRQWAEEQVAKWGYGHTFSWRLSRPKNAYDFAMFVNEPGFKWICVNMESLIRPGTQKAIAIFKRRAGRCMLVADESHHFGRAGAKRTAVMRGLGRQFEYRRILTGTPIENSPRQAFPQFEILEREALGHRTMGSFDREFTVYGQGYGPGGRRFPKIEGYQNMDTLRDRMSKYASVVLRSDCRDLPPLQRDRRIVEMTTEQTRWWNIVKEKALLEAEALGHDRVFSGGAALVKLQQIEGGHWLEDDGSVREIVPLEQNPKMLILLDEIEQYDDQVVCWFEYVHELEAAMTALTRAKIPAGRFHGRVKSSERDETLRKFKSGFHKVLLAQPRAGGEGRDMSAAGKIVWYSHTPDAIVRNQADERATAMGGRSVQVVDIVAPVGDYFLGLTARKTGLADDVGRRGLREVLERMRR